MIALRRHGLVILIWLLSVPIKFTAAQNMPWDIDIVPVVQRNVQYLIPPVGTLSSVAAYNLPMLEWLHLPAQWLTGDVWWTIFLTMMAFNLLSTGAVYALGYSMFDKRVAVVAATLFTFSEVGVSSAYTAWAQLLLPGFFAMVMLCLWLWYQQDNGLWLALTGIVATAGFMTHFSALLLFPAMLVVAIVIGAKWHWRWLVFGAGVVVIMLAPYVAFEMGRDFVDVRAFASQEVLVSDAVMAEVEIYKPGNNLQASTSPQQTDVTGSTTPQNTEEIQAMTSVQVRPRWLRAIDYALEAPLWYVKAMTTAFNSNVRGIANAVPYLAPIVSIFLRLQMILFMVSIIAASWQFVRAYPQQTSIRETFTETQSGRLLILVGFLTVMIALMVVTRTINNSTYWMGFISIEIVIASYAVTLLPTTPRMTVMIAVGLLLYVAIQNIERGLRLVQHDDSQFSAYNISLYRHVEAAVDYIADDWTGDEEITVSYDILPDVRHFWWVPAWHSIDPSYRMGMNFDFLLSYHHGLENSNQDAIGTVPDADYIVLYTPSLVNYDLNEYDVRQFGAIVVLKPH